MFARTKSTLDQDNNNDSIVTLAFKYIDNNLGLNNLYEKNKRFEKVLSLSLLLSSYEPSRRELIGTFWIDEYCFAMRTRNFAKTYGVTNREINQHLKNHHIIQVGKMKLETLIDFKDRNNWKIMKDETGNYRRSKVMSGYQNLLKFELHCDKKIKKEERSTITNIGSETNIDNIINNINIINETDDIKFGFEFEFDFLNLTKESDDFNAFCDEDEFLPDFSLEF